MSNNAILDNKIINNLKDKNELEKSLLPSIDKSKKENKNDLGCGLLSRKTKRENKNRVIGNSPKVKKTQIRCT